MLCFFTSSHRFGVCGGSASRYFAACWAWLRYSKLSWYSTSRLSFIWVFSCIPVVADCCLWLWLSITSSYAKGQQFSWSVSSSTSGVTTTPPLFVSNFVRGWLFTCLFRVWVVYMLCSLSKGGAQTPYRNDNLHTALPVVSGCPCNFIFVQIWMKLVIKQLHSNMSLSWLFYFILFCSFPLLLPK